MGSRSARQGDQSIAKVARTFGIGSFQARAGA